MKAKVLLKDDKGKVYYTQLPSNKDVIYCAWDTRYPTRVLLCVFVPKKEKKEKDKVGG